MEQPSSCLVFYLLPTGAATARAGLSTSIKVTGTVLQLRLSIQVILTCDNSTLKPTIHSRVRHDSMGKGVHTGLTTEFNPWIPYRGGRKTLQGCPPTCTCVSQNVCLIARTRALTHTQSTRISTMFKGHVGQTSLVGYGFSLCHHPVGIPLGP